jgi:hypothetical protein
MPPCSVLDAATNSWTAALTPTPGASSSNGRAQRGRRGLHERPRLCAASYGAHGGRRQPSLPDQAGFFTARSSSSP